MGVGDRLGVSDLLSYRCACAGAVTTLEALQRLACAVRGRIAVARRRIASHARGACPARRVARFHVRSACQPAQASVISRNASNAIEACRAAKWRLWRLSQQGHACDMVARASAGQHRAVPRGGESTLAVMQSCTPH